MPLIINFNGLIVAFVNFHFPHPLDMLGKVIDFFIFDLTVLALVVVDNWYIYIFTNLSFTKFTDSRSASERIHLFFVRGGALLVLLLFNGLSCLILF